MTMRKKTGHGIAAVLLAMSPIPVVASIVIGVKGGFAEAAYAFFFWSFWIGIISFLTALLIGAPLYLLLNKLKLNNWLCVFLSGLGIGALVGNWLFPYSAFNHSSLVFSLIGGYAALAYKYGAEQLNANKANNANSLI